MGKNNSFDTLFAKETQKSFNLTETPKVELKPTNEESAYNPKKSVKKEESNKKETVNINLRIYKQNYLDLKNYCEQEGLSLNQAINKAIKDLTKPNTNNN